MTASSLEEKGTKSYFKKDLFASVSVLFERVLNFRYLIYWIFFKDKN